MRTNLEIAKEIYTLAKGLDKIANKRKVFSDNPDEAKLTFNLIGARDKAKRLAVELAQDEAIEQEINDQDNLENETNSTRNLNN